MNPGAPKDAVQDVPQPRAEAAVFNAPDLQVGGNRDNLAAKSDDLVAKGVVPAMEFTGDTSAKFIKTQMVDQATVDAENKGKGKGPELAAATSDAATVPPKPGEQPGDQPQAKAPTPDGPVDKVPPARPDEVPVDKVPPARPGEVPVDKVPPARPGEVPVDKVPPARPDEVPVDKVPPARPGEVPTDKIPASVPAEAPPASPTDAQATNPQFLENAKVRRGEGPYQVASRLLAADGQPTKQADVKALTEAFKKVYGDQQKADPNLPGLAGLKQNHAFINKDNLKAVTDELKKSGHGELAERLTKDATAKAPEAAPKPGDATPAKPGDAPPANPTDQPPKQFSSQDIANEAIKGITQIPREKPLDPSVERLGTAIDESFKQRPDLFKPGTTKDTITEELNKGAEKSEDPRIKGKEFYWDPNNKLKLRDKPKPAATRPTVAPPTELSA
ncbi:MAG: hypothetical protein IPP57_24735 [Candidatus Obscuribacter sp.]|nr:hypothetical protein [Candidatus Obscuribacter sp.]